ncbi:hypothetical protein M422DRAFT_34574 [Sphaerobolus stellatus SS14]|uniref:Uncharacterized protein n=1 Tax=Sphaerobolus stellatus (strain SS14) TaxID=990650 RepID=A0A0C9V2C8_SPHS4|nr:hypothetical protein M422DRAFT_34574 [Sphaerobolus stellatus SS14]
MNPIRPSNIYPACLLNKPVFNRHKYSWHWMIHGTRLPYTSDNFVEKAISIRNTGAARRRLLRFSLLVYRQM